MIFFYPYIVLANKIKNTSLKTLFVLSAWGGGENKGMNEDDMNNEINIEKKILEDAEKDLANPIGKWANNSSLLMMFSKNFSYIFSSFFFERTYDFLSKFYFSLGPHKVLWKGIEFRNNYFLFYEIGWFPEFLRIGENCRFGLFDFSFNLPIFLLNFLYSAFLYQQLLEKYIENYSLSYIAQKKRELKDAAANEDYKTENSSSISNFLSERTDNNGELKQEYSFYTAYYSDNVSENDKKIVAGPCRAYIFKSAGVRAVWRFRPNLFLFLHDCALISFSPTSYLKIKILPLSLFYRLWELNDHDVKEINDGESPWASQEAFFKSFIFTFFRYFLRYPSHRYHLQDTETFYRYGLDEYLGYENFTIQKLALCFQFVIEVSQVVTSFYESDSFIDLDDMVY